MTEKKKETKESTPIKLVELDILKELQPKDSSEGFFCDVNTGVCGPIQKEKEVK